MKCSENAQILIQTQIYRHFVGCVVISDKLPLQSVALQGVAEGVSPGLDASAVTGGLEDEEVDLQTQSGPRMTCVFGHETYASLGKVNIGLARGSEDGRAGTLLSPAVLGTLKLDL